MKKKKINISVFLKGSQNFRIPIGKFNENTSPHMVLHRGSRHALFQFKTKFGENKWTFSFFFFFFFFKEKINSFIDSSCKSVCQSKQCQSKQCKYGYLIFSDKQKFTIGVNQLLRQWSHLRPFIFQFFYY